MSEPVAAAAEPTGSGPTPVVRDSASAPSEPAAPVAAPAHPPAAAAVAPAAARPEPEDDGPEPVEDLGVAEEPAPSERTTVGGIDTAAIRRAWPDVLEKVFGMSRVTSTLISQNAHVLDYDGQRLLLGIKTSGLANTFRSGNHAELVRQALIDVIGVDVRVEGIPAPDAAPDPAAPTPAAAPAAPAAPTAPASGAATGSSAAEQMRQERPTPTRPAPEDTTDWASAPAQGAPSWATEDDRPAPPTTGQAVPAAPPAAEPAPAPAEAAPSAGSDESQEQAPAEPEPAGSRMARARAALGASGPEEPVKLHVADDSAVSVDDEDIAEAGDVGRPVLERVFGARVVEEEGP